MVVNEIQPLSSEGLQQNPKTMGTASHRMDRFSDLQGVVCGLVTSLSGVVMIGANESQRRRRPRVAEGGRRWPKRLS